MDACDPRTWEVEAGESIPLYVGGHLGIQKPVFQYKQVNGLCWDGRCGGIQHAVYQISFPFLVLKLRKVDWEFEVSLSIIVKQNRRNLIYSMLYTWHNLFKLHSVYMVLTFVLKTSWCICFSKNQCWLCIAWIIGKSRKKWIPQQLLAMRFPNMTSSLRDHLSWEGAVNCTVIYSNVLQGFIHLETHCD